MSDYVVVGGGIAGLVAARELVLRGHDVTLLEASDRLGGQIASHTVAGITLDAGAESFAVRGGSVADLLRRLDLTGEIVEPATDGAWLYRPDRTAIALPRTSLLGIPGSPLASDVIAAIGGRAAFRAYSEALLPSIIGAKSSTLGELVRSRMGPRVLEGLVAPVVLGVHSRHPDDLELDRVAPGLRSALLREGTLASAVRSLQPSSRAGSAVAGVRGGMHKLVAALEADLGRFGVRVRLAAAATSIESDAVFVGDERFDGRVVLAARPPDHKTPGDQAPGRQVALVTLVVDEPALDGAPRGSGLLVASGGESTAGPQAKALTHVTAKWEWALAASAGLHVLRLSYDEAPPYDRAIADARTLLDVPLATVTAAATVRWTRYDRQVYSDDGIIHVGETAAGTGLANIVGHTVETIATAE